MANRLMTLEVSLIDPATGRQASERVDISMSALLGELGEDRVPAARTALVESFKAMVDRCYLRAVDDATPSLSTA